jgi:hypothetical protein
MKICCATSPMPNNKDGGRCELGVLNLFAKFYSLKEPQGDTEKTEN